MSITETPRHTHMTQHAVAAQAAFDAERGRWSGEYKVAQKMNNENGGEGTSNMKGVTSNRPQGEQATGKGNKQQARGNKQQARGNTQRVPQ